MKYDLKAPIPTTFFPFRVYTGCHHLMVSSKPVAKTKARSFSSPGRHFPCLVMNYSTVFPIAYYHFNFNAASGQISPPTDCNFKKHKI